MVAGREKDTDYGEAVVVKPLFLSLADATNHPNDARQKIIRQVGRWIGCCVAVGSPQSSPFCNQPHSHAPESPREEKTNTTSRKGREQPAHVFRHRRAPSKHRRHALAAPAVEKIGAAAQASFWGDALLQARIRCYNAPAAAQLALLHARLRGRRCHTPAAELRWSRWSAAARRRSCIGAGGPLKPWRRSCIGAGGPPKPRRRSCIGAGGPLQWRSHAWTMMLLCSRWSAAVALPCLHGDVALQQVVTAAMNGGAALQRRWCCVGAGHLVEACCELALRSRDGGLLRASAARWLQSERRCCESPGPLAGCGGERIFGKIH